MNLTGNTLKKYGSYISLIILTIIVSLIAYYRVIIQIDLGPISDTCDFLSNALVFAGQGMGYSDLIRPPFFSFLLSIPFRMGFVSTAAIFALDGIMYIFGVIGLYFLLKIHFNEIESFLGGLLYATFSIVLVVLGVGFSDLASVSIAIWAFYFLILAIEKDSKFFYLAFPMVMLSFLTRYNNALLIFPIFVYILINKDKIKSMKNIIGGIFVSLLLLVPVFLFFIQKFGNPFYPLINFFGTSSNPVSPENAAYDPNLFFFVEKLPLFIGIEGIIIIFIIIFGLLIYAFLKMRKNSLDIKGSFQKLIQKNSKLNLILFTALTIIILVSIGKISYLYSEILLFIWIYSIYHILKHLNIKNLEVHLLVLAWFLAFFLLHSGFLIKDNRYFVLMAPQIAYFLVLGLSAVCNRLKFKIRGYNLTFPIIAVIISIMLILSTASFLPVIQQANEDNKITNENIITACQWFANYDPNYKNKTIYADLWPNFAWYLQTNVKPMPVFKDNQKYYGGVKEFNLTPQDNIAYNNELNNNNADYYFSIRPGLNLTNYEPIKKSGNLIIYKRVE